MDDPLSRGLPFELADIWRRSTFQLKDEDQSLFAPLEASFPSLELDLKRDDFQDALVIPMLDEVNTSAHSQHLEPPDSDIASPPSELWDTGQSAPDDPASVWDVNLNRDLPPERPRLHTWEAFEKKAVPNAGRTAYLSEAGPGTFDAVLAQREGKSNGVLPQDVMLRALCNLSLGRASVFFRWDEHKNAFTRTLEDVPISGYSSTTCDSFIQRLMDYATRYRLLRLSCTESRPKRDAPPCIVAFHGCVSSTLDAIEEHITNQLSQVRSVLQLQNLVSLPHDLVATLDNIGRSVNKATSDEGVISTLSDHVCELTSANSSLAGMLRSILERTSAPWLERLATDLGLIDDQVAATRPDEGADESSADLDSSIATARPRMAELSGFMSAEDRVLIHDTKASLRVLRKTLPHYAGSEEARRLFQSALGHNSRLVTSTTDAGPAFEDVRHTAEEGLAWAEAEIQHRFLARGDLQMSSLPQHPHGQDDNLRLAVLSYCSTNEQSTDHTSSLTFDVSPLDRLRPAISAQSRHLNRTLLQHLFTNGLIHHLRLQHSYHLLHSGEFITRLSTALFSSETQSAERKRGTIPTGQAMGLRLGARNEQRWPPASSELRLTLVDVLTETYRSEYPSKAEAAKRSTKDPLPGGLSFSIRELPEAEIERVMDSTSIYALDFLRLQYTAPAPLDAILTSAVMQTYDAVFRFLLRVFRVLHVTTALTRTVANRQQQKVSKDIRMRQMRFAHHTHAFTTTLLSHMMDVGISAPSRSFMHALGAIENSLKGSDAGATVNIGIECLKDMHISCLDTIRSRLFLRRKQERLRLALERVLSAVLKGAASLEEIEDNGEDGNGDGDEQTNVESVESEFAEGVKGLLKLLRSAVDKPPKARATGSHIDEGADDDVEIMRGLLMRLDWNGVYDESR